VIWALLFAFGVVFVELVIALDLRAQVLAIHAGARGALRVLASDASDAEKEAASRRASVSLFRDTGIFLLKLFAVAVVLAIAYFAVALIWPAGGRGLEAGLTSPVEIAVLSVVLVLYAWGRHAVVKRLQRA
jgi:hypothetical protein